jgi:hypothetical protein
MASYLLRSHPIDWAHPVQPLREIVDETAMPQVLYFYNSNLLFLSPFICLLKQTEAKFVVTDINSRYYLYLSITV